MAKNPHEKIPSARQQAESKIFSGRLVTALGAAFFSMISR
jgi:hypothetical protein